MKVLLIKTSALGDVLQTLPLLAALKGCEVDWVVEARCASALHSVPAISQVIEVNTKEGNWNFSLLREKEYDLIFDLQGNCKSALLTWRARGKRKVGFTFRQAPEWPAALVLTDRVRVDSHLPLIYQYLTLIQAGIGFAAPFSPEPLYLFQAPSSALPAKTLVVCPCSRWENKRLSLSQWHLFLNRVAEQGWAFQIVYGSQEEKSYAAAIAQGLPNAPIIGEMTVVQWQELMSRSCGVITVDSSALHLAFLTGIPHFSIFGPSQGERYAPPGENSTYFQGECPYKKHFIKRCPILRTCSTGACIKEIDPLDLYSGFKEWAEEIQKSTEQKNRCDSPLQKSPH